MISRPSPPAAPKSESTPRPAVPPRVAGQVVCLQPVRMIWCYLDDRSARSPTCHGRLIDGRPAAGRWSTGVSSPVIPAGQAAHSSPDGPLMMVRPWARIGYPQIAGAALGGRERNRVRRQQIQALVEPTI